LPSIISLAWTAILRSAQDDPACLPGERIGEGADYGALNRQPHLDPTPSPSSDANRSPRARRGTVRDAPHPLRRSAPTRTSTSRCRPQLRSLPGDLAAGVSHIQRDGSEPPQPPADGLGPRRAALDDRARDVCLEP